MAPRPALYCLSRLQCDKMSFYRPLRRFHSKRYKVHRDLPPTLSFTTSYINIYTLADCLILVCLFSGSALLAQAEDDELITLVCKHDSLSYLTPLTSKRSALQRSPTLAKFFQSSDYLVGSGTQLEFHEIDPACLRVIKEYLEDGPDICTADTLRSHASQEIASRKVYDFLLVVYVHKLAAKLGLRSLMNLAYDVLYQLEYLVTPRDCINIIGLVFNTDYHFDNTIQNWLLEHVDRHFYSLSGSCEWANVMVQSSIEFKVLWANVTLNHLRPVSTISTTNEEAKASLPTSVNPLPAKPDNTVADSNSEATVYDDLSDDDCYEPQDYARGRSDRENAKARRVLGINNDGGGFIAGRVDRKKRSGLSRASKSLMGLMKRE